MPHGKVVQWVKLYMCSSTGSSNSSGSNGRVTGRASVAEPCGTANSTKHQVQPSSESVLLDACYGKFVPKCNNPEACAALKSDADGTVGCPPSRLETRPKTVARGSKSKKESTRIDTLPDARTNSALIVRFNTEVLQVDGWMTL